MLEKGQPDHHQHTFVRLRSERFTTAIIGRASCGKEESPFFHPVCEPRPTVFSLLNLYTSPDVIHTRSGSLTEGMCNASTTGGRAITEAFISRHASPRPVARHFSANIANQVFGGSCLRNWHGRSFNDGCPRARDRLRLSGNIPCDSRARACRTDWQPSLNLVNRELAGGVNGARSRVISWDRVTYVGGEPNQSARKRTDQTVYLSIWCQRIGPVMSPKKSGAILWRLQVFSLRGYALRQ
jgi:hypothetical protein